MDVAEKMKMLVKDATAARVACNGVLSEHVRKSFEDIDDAACGELMNMILLGGADEVLLLAELIYDDMNNRKSETLYAIRNAVHVIDRDTKDISKEKR